MTNDPQTLMLAEVIRASGCLDDVICPNCGGCISIPIDEEEPHQDYAYYCVHCGYSDSYPADAIKDNVTDYLFQ